VAEGQRLDSIADPGDNGAAHDGRLLEAVGALVGTLLLEGG